MNQNPAAAGRNSQTYYMTVTALMTAVLCVLAPLSIPIGPVPITLTNLVLYISLFLLGWRWCAMSCLAYLLIGMAGLPVFSGFAGGLGKLAGPTGGYIVGFLPMVVLAGLAVDRFRGPLPRLAGMVLGTGVCYAFGTAWYCFAAGVPPMAALGACVLPFVPFDLGKMALALAAGPLLRRRLEQAGLHRR